MNVYTLTRRGGEKAKARGGCYKKVVRARNAHEARRTADKEVGREGHIWKHAHLSSCRLLRLAGRPFVVCEDYYG